MSTYIKLSTLEYPRHIGDIEIDPAGPTDYAPVQWVEPPSFNPATERIRQLTPVQTDGQWSTAWEVYPIPFDEMASKVREERNKKLTACDWTQLDDTPLTNTDKAAWAAYRQQLRDLTTQPGFPYEVVWPNTP